MTLKPIFRSSQDPTNKTYENIRKNARKKQLTNKICKKITHKTTTPIRPSPRDEVWIHRSYKRLSKERRSSRARSFERETSTSKDKKRDKKKQELQENEGQASFLRVFYGFSKDFLRVFQGFSTTCTSKCDDVRHSSTSKKLRIFNVVPFDLFSYS